jgi:hypothetical protein
MAIQAKQKSKGDRTSQARRDASAHSKVGSAGSSLRPDFKHAERRTAMRMDYLEFKSMLESFGIIDRNFIAPFYSQLSEADGFGGDGLEFIAAVIKNQAPHDCLEAMSAAQLGAVNWVGLKYLRQVADLGGTGHQELAVNTATKLFRTFSAQLDAHNRYRAGRERKVTTKHVMMKDGHQLIEQVSSRQPALKKADDPPALTDSRQPEMETLESEKQAWLEHVRKKQADA